MQLWFKRVPGFASHSDIYVHGILDTGPGTPICSNSFAKNCIIYFGGDIQNSEDLMQNHSENSSWSNFSLERTAALLFKKFFNENGQNVDNLSQPIVMVICPQSFSSGTFSHFSQFVDSADFTGSPIYSSVGWRAWNELATLAENVLRLASSGSPTGSLPTGVQHAYTLVGFSKGCVVLNQLLLELSRLNLACRASARTPSSDTNGAVAQPAARFASSVQRWVWLDGGHNGSAPVWLQDAAAVSTFTEAPLAELELAAAPTRSPTPVHVHVAVSPYQMRDSRRPHIGRQCARFCELLRDRQALAPCGSHIASAAIHVRAALRVRAAFSSLSLWSSRSFLSDSTPELTRFRAPFL